MKQILMTAFLLWPVSFTGYTTAAELPPHSATDRILIRFQDDLDPDRVLDMMTNPVSHNAIPELIGSSWKKMVTSVSAEKLGRLHAKAEQKLGRSLPDPRQYRSVTLAGDHAGQALDVIRDHVQVAKAWHVPLPVSPPSFHGSDDDSMNQQVYLFEEHGVDAIHAWDMGLSGNGIQICDIEWGFDPDHCDLPEIEMIGELYGCSGHGTMVLGVMAGLDNNQGVKGIAHGSDFYFSSAGWAPYDTVVDSILAATDLFDPGSIILIEKHMGGPNYKASLDANQGLIPMEWYEPIYDANIIAIANGMNVVMCAGNGYENLDDPIYSQGNDGHHPFLPENDSGAIYVGAGRAWTYPRSRIGYSNYGWRVNLQGWGEWVYTTSDNGNCSSHCAHSYMTGTSAAAPIVAGCLALIQEQARNTTGQPLSPAMARHVLTVTGRPQTDGEFPQTENIGPLPDLEEAILYMKILPQDVIYVPDEFQNLHSAVDYAEDGDRIMVRPGTYTGSLDSVFEVHDKSIRIIGIGGPGQTRIDCQNSRRGILIDSANCAIEGFTITNGQATEGGGVKIMDASPTFLDCVIDDNSASSSAGGVFVSSGSPEFTDCFFKDNESSAYGGGTAIFGGSSIFYSCTFQGNEALFGGGIYAQDSDATILMNSCTFQWEDSISQGGAMFLNNCTSSIQNCVIRFCESAFSGGGIQASASSLDIINTDLRFNDSLNGAGISLYQSDAEVISSVIGSNEAANGGGVLVEPGSSLVLNNTVLCDNTEQDIIGDYVDDGWNCFTISCQDTDPRDGEIDGCRCLGDATRDGVVDIEDLLLVTEYWGGPGGIIDFDDSGEVDIADLLQVINAWGDDPCNLGSDQ